MKIYQTIGLLLLLGVSIINPIHGQVSHTDYQPLKVGDKVPDYMLINLINYPTNTAKITDFKGKLLILDFWNTTCRSCIESWPKLLKLQEQFKDQIQIILVNPFQEEALIKKAFDRRKRSKNVEVTLPSVCGDPTIKKLFPYKGVPHIVWIDPDGMVKAFTGGRSLNAKNIRASLENSSFQLSQKQEVAADFHVDLLYPLFVNGNGGNGEALMSYSVFSKKVNGFPASSALVADSLNGYSIMASNVAIKDLYSFAYSNYKDPYGNIRFLLGNRVKLQMTDTSSYVMFDSSGEPKDENRYVYQYYSARPTTKGKLQKMMQTDLERHIGLKAQWEKRKMPCLVLSARDTALIAYSSGDHKIIIDDIHMDINNASVSDVLKNMELVTNYYYSPYPLIDETGYKGKLGHIKFETDIYDHQALDKALKKYKMGLKLEDREVAVLVLDEPEGYQFPYTNKSQWSEKHKWFDAKRKAYIKVKTSENLKDWEAYQKHIIEYMNTYLIDNTYYLGDYASIFYENEFITSDESLDEAIKWIKKGIDLTNLPFYHYYYAALLYKRGLRQEALAAAQVLVANKWMPTRTAELIAKINSMEDL